MLTMQNREGRIPRGASPPKRPGKMPMIEGSCLCGAVRWQFDGTPLKALVRAAVALNKS